MKDGKLSPTERDEIAAWNSHGLEVTDVTMRKFLPSWFDNIRALIHSNIPLQNIDELIPKFESKRSIVILGSGPGAITIARDLPYNDPNILLICGPTCAGTVLANKRRPDILMVADSNPEQYEVIRELDPDDIFDWDIVLPVTAASNWYDNDSIFHWSQLHFYFPFLDYLGSGDLAYNDILCALFPGVHKYIKQAGSVGNAMIGLADMLCGESSSKRIYAGIDCCSWLDPLILRAPAAVKNLNGSYSTITSELQKRQAVIESEDAFTLKTLDRTLQTNLTSIGYAIQMFYLFHQMSRNSDRANRFVLLSESARLFSFLAKGIRLPIIHSYEVGMSINPVSSDEWAYNTMLELIRLSNKKKHEFVEADIDKGE
jgi:hypothetical protein